MNSVQSSPHRFSTALWVEQFTRKSESHKESLLKRFEENYSSHSVDPDERPVNILCLDGGGMKGYALPAILKIIQERYGDKEPNILSLFDLVAGTSVGGAVALACNTMKSLQAACDEFEDGADDIREYTFSNMNLKHLLRTGDAVQEKNQMIQLYKSRCGNKPLLNPGGPPAFALAAARGKSNTMRKRSKKAYEPLILRTYEYPDDPITNGSQCKALADSVSSLTLAESIAATTAMPAVVHRIKVPIDDKEVSLADGGLYGNCPISFAIDEIRRLYPRRPLGVILSIGYNSKTPEEDLIYQAVRIARKINPGVHFQRLVPHEITGDFDTIETSLDRVIQMENEIEEYFRTNSEASIALDETMKNIFAQDRPLNKYTTEVGSFEYNLRDKMLSSDIYLERKKRRSDIRTRLQESRDMAKDITKERNIQPALETISLKDQRDGSNIVAIDVENINDSTASKGLDHGDLEAYSEDWDIIVSDETKDYILTEERKLDWKISCITCQAYSCCQQTSSGAEECTDNDENIDDIVAMSMERGEDTSEESPLSVDDNKDNLELSASHADDIANKKDPMLSKPYGNSRDGSIDAGSLSPSNSSSSEESADDAESGVNIVTMTVGYDEDVTKSSQSMDDYEDVLEFPPCIEDGASRNCPLSSKVDGYTYDGSSDTISSASSQNGEQSIVSTIRSLFSL